VVAFLILTLLTLLIPSSSLLIFTFVLFLFILFFFFFPSSYFRDVARNTWSEFPTYFIQSLVFRKQIKVRKKLTVLWIVWHIHNDLIILYTASCLFAYKLD
jgi:hypothetical protein